MQGCQTTEITMNTKIEPSFLAATSMLKKQKIQSSIFTTLQNILITAVLSVFVIVALRADYIWIGNGLGEKSFTELFQSLLLLSCALSFYKLTQKNYLSSASVLVCGFFCVLLIRELDAYFDQIRHGFWIYPALTVTAISIVLALRNGNVVRQMAALLEDNNMQVMISFVILLFVFSRLYGMSEFWKSVMSDYYIRDVKNISEETIELLCYSFIALYASKTKNALLKPVC